MFEPDATSARVIIAVVAYGDTPRLHRCIESLVGHKSRATFQVVCVVNPDARTDGPSSSLPADVPTLRPTLNLGWAGGLHLARTLVGDGTEFFVWAQDDMVVAPGWLDALVTEADGDPSVGAVGSVEVDPETRLPNGYSGGYADPAGRVGLWNLTDAIADGTYRKGEGLDWITSKGMLTRIAAWDDVGGTDPRLFPLNHVDKDYSIHLRAHGWRLTVAPDAHLFHAKHQSAPGLFRQFVAVWQEPEFDREWGPVAAALPAAREGVAHECRASERRTIADVEAIVAREATRMLVPLGRAAQSAADGATVANAEVEAMRRTLSWRITSPLRFVRRLRVRRGLRYPTAASESTDPDSGVRAIE